MHLSTPYEVRLVSGAFVEERWSEVSELLEAAFSNAVFLKPSSTAKRPALNTWERMHEPDARWLGHVLAVDRAGTILGGLFCLPIERPENETRCDLGWFFTAATLSGAQREAIGDAVMRKGHEELTKSSYEAVVTRMGTEAIAEFMTWRHRYLPAPLDDETDRWIKSLRTGPASINSVKQQWQNEAAQLARYATTNIAKDEIIIDLTMLLERTDARSAQSLQLGDGRYYRSSEGPFGLNHSCSPNGYIRFEDLTYRALRNISEGEELTFHYCQTEYEMTSPFDCLCGSPDCLGRVSGFKYLNESQVEAILPYVSPVLKSKL